MVKAIDEKELFNLHFCALICEKLFSKLNGYIYLNLLVIKEITN